MTARTVHLLTLRHETWNTKQLSHMNTFGRIAWNIEWGSLVWFGLGKGSHRKGSKAIRIFARTLCWAEHIIIITREMWNIQEVIFFCFCFNSQLLQVGICVHPKRKRDPLTKAGYDKRVDLHHDEYLKNKYLLFQVKKKQIASPRWGHDEAVDFDSPRFLIFSLDSASPRLQAHISIEDLRASPSILECCRLQNFGLIPLM